MLTQKFQINCTRYTQTRHINYRAQKTQLFRVFTLHNSTGNRSVLKINRSQVMLSVLYTENVGHMFISLESLIGC